ncbi:MAG: hypothetical protein AAFN92_14045 [Bacteroidota bacterium]
MKISFSLFCAGFLLFFVTDYFEQIRPAIHLATTGTVHPEVQAYRERISTVIDATNSSRGERRFPDPGFLDRIRANPGFRIVHDPSLGGEVIARGPKNVLAFLELTKRSGRLGPDFDRPVRLRELVEIRVNLHAHGSQQMRISLNRAREGRTILQPDFATAGPLQFQLLSFTNLPDHPVQVASQDVIVRGDEPHTNSLTGTAGRLEFTYWSGEDDSPLTEASAPNLRAGKVLHTKIY